MQAFRQTGHRASRPILCRTIPQRLIETKLAAPGFESHRSTWRGLTSAGKPEAYSPKTGWVRLLLGPSLDLFDSYDTAESRALPHRQSSHVSVACIPVKTYFSGLPG